MPNKIKIQVMCKDCGTAVDFFIPSVYRFTITPTDVNTGACEIERCICGREMSLQLLATVRWSPRSKAQRRSKQMSIPSNESVQQKLAEAAPEINQRIQDVKDSFKVDPEVLKQPLKSQPGQEGGSDEKLSQGKEE